MCGEDTTPEIRVRSDDTKPQRTSAVLIKDISEEKMQRVVA